VTKTQATLSAKRVLAYGYHQPDSGHVWAACPRCHEHVTCAHTPTASVPQRVASLRTELVTHLTEGCPA